MRCFAFAASLALAFIVFAEPTAAQSRPQLIIGVNSFPPNLHPVINDTVARNNVHSLARRSLVHFDAEWRLVCDLCVEAPSLQNGKAKIVDLPGGGKGVAASFTLKPGLKWADGVPITSKDVVFSLELGKRGDLGFGDVDFWAAVDRIDALNESDFVIHYNKMRYDFDRGFAILPEHIEGPIYRGLSDPKEYNRNSAYNRAPTTPGLYNGPYKITQIETGQFIRFERNEFWTGEKPAFDRIILRTIENTSALEQNLLSGDIDYVLGELGLSLDQALALQKRAADKFNFVFQPGLLYEHVALNLDNPALADKRVRQALLMAIDRATMVGRLYEDRQPVAHSWVHPRDRGYNPDVKKYGHDPAAAKRLLDEAGFKPGAGGVRQNADGVKLSFEFVTTAGMKFRELVQQVIQSQMKEIGVELALKNEPVRTFLGQTMKERRFTGLAMWALPFSPEPLPVLQLRSDGIPTKANNFAGLNVSGFKSERMDKLIDAAVGELDPEVRRDHLSQMQAIYAEELPGLPLYFRTDPFVIPKWLTGVQPTGHRMPSTYWIHQWRAN